MNLFLAVNKGSRYEPRFVHVFMNQSNIKTYSFSRKRITFLIQVDIL